MPFTPTHMLAVVPIAAAGRGRLPFSALAIGCMIPDLPLFVPWAPSYGSMHSARGIVAACLPIGLLGFLLFQFAMKQPLNALLPEGLRRRCSTAAATRPALDPKALALASLAVVIGAVTHVVWDAFTHEGRWGTDLLPRLNEPMLKIAGVDVAGYKAFQYVSSLLGLPALGAIAAVWLSRQAPRPVDPPPSLPGWARIAGSLTVLGPPLAVAALAWNAGGPTGARLFLAITNAGLALILATLAYCLIYLFTVREP